MSFLAEQTTIEDYFTDNWSHTVIAYDNVEFNPKDHDEWVRFVIRPSTARQSAMGDVPAHRYFGNIFVQIFTKSDIGVGRSLTLADYVTALFRSVNISGIQFRTPNVTRIGNMEDGWFQVNVDCPYFREEFAS